MFLIFRYDVFLSLPSKGKELIGRIAVEQGGSYTPFFQRRFSKDVMLIGILNEPYSYS